MVRTAATAARSSGGKSAKAVAKSSNSGGSSTSSKSGSSTRRTSSSSGGGNSIQHRPTPKWQKPISTFFIKNNLELDNKENAIQECHDLNVATEADDQLCLETPEWQKPITTFFNKCDENVSELVTDCALPNEIEESYCKASCSKSAIVENTQNLKRELDDEIKVIAVKRQKISYKHLEELENNVESLKIKR